MDIRTTLLKEHSKTNTAKIVDYIGDSQIRFDDLMEIFLEENPILMQRAAWVVGHSGVEQPQLVVKHFQAMIDNLKKSPIHDAIKRNTVRIWQYMDIPEEHMGSIASVCFDYLGNPKEAVAIRSFSMTVLHNITKQIPELQNELRLLIEDQMPHGTSGFRGRGRKILKALNKS